VVDRPEPTPHRPERRGFIGPFSARQLILAIGAVLVAAVILVAVTTPLGSAGGNQLPAPQATSYVIGSPTVGLGPGSVAPELAVPDGNGGTFQLTDPDGRPIRLADYRGKAVWLNFWTTWCPPCQSETPIIREMADTYRSKGLEVIAVDVQETMDGARQYAARYGLKYTIGADVSGDVFRAFRAFALPTHFFIAPDGTVRYVVSRPLDRQSAVGYIESILPAGGGSGPSGSAASRSPAPAASPSPTR